RLRWRATRGFCDPNRHSSTRSTSHDMFALASSAAAVRVTVPVNSKRSVVARYVTFDARGDSNRRERRCPSARHGPLVGER
ncbi:hypothetical protein BE221DRAFT_67485, partial [Ostreococcus tauri]